MRLHDLHGPNLFDLSLIFRQHEICRRPRRHFVERRVALIGNSAVFGLYVSAEETFAGRLNERWNKSKAPLHVYNLGFVTAYQFKDALIMRQVLDYEPNLIVYGISIADFVHLAPIPWPNTLPSFFAANGAAIDRLSDEGAAGLEYLVETYRERDAYRGWPGQRWARFRESGAYLRLAARQNSPILVNRWLLSPEDGPVRAAPDPGRILQQGLNYQCQKVLENFDKTFGENWKSWNVLAYLEQLQRERQIDIVVVGMPNRHDPNGACYNARLSTRENLEYRRWLRDQTSSRNLELWDLHDLLKKSQFEDSVHPNESGHRAIANELARRIETHVATAISSAATSDFHAASRAPDLVE